uniref:Uncharacterized protein n=1 Tax=Latimeria chalumnae TaxID=7897 RepID=H3B1Z1_LATCH
WVHIEESEVAFQSLPQALYSSSCEHPGQEVGNPFSKLLIQVWHKAHDYIGQKKYISPFMHKWKNHALSPSFCDGAFEQWYMQDIKEIGDLYNEGILIYFEQIMDKFQIPKKHFYQYLQIKHVIGAKKDGSLSAPIPFPLEFRVVKINTLYKFITQTYKNLQSFSHMTTDSSRLKWERIGIRSSYRKMEGHMPKHKKIAITNKYKLNHFKTVHDLYYTPKSFTPLVKHKINGIVVHMIWSCWKLTGFWQQVLQLVGDTLVVKLLSHLSLTVLLDTTQIQTLEKWGCRFLCLVILVVRKVIMQHWRASGPPLLSEWSKDLCTCMNLERIHYMVNLQAQIFQKNLGGPPIGFSDG